jgi:hypothetical protein
MFTINLTAEQLNANYELVLDIIHKYFTGDRKSKLLTLFEDYKDKIIISPASSMNHFHSAYPGGYCVHTLLVIDIVEKLYQLWKSLGSDVSGYDLSELIFVALIHDFGKLGSIEQDYYIINDSEWHIKNRGELYKRNPELENVRHEERSIYILNQYGIKLSINEFIGILAHNGAYDEASKFYFDQFNDERKLRTNLPIIFHHADYMAYRIEYENEKKLRSNKPKTKTTIKDTKKALNINEKNNADILKSFADLFEEE